MTLLSLLLVACGDKDPACTETAWFLDADADGHGGSDRVDACEAPSGYVAQSTDCDDADATAYPGADELCDGADNDCDAQVDEEPVDGLDLFADADGDGFGDADTPAVACAAGEGLVEDDSDCDDADPAAFPGAEEVCDGADNDCDGATDGPSYPGDFATLDEAVAGVSDGDLLCIGEGDFDEALELDGRSLRIGGAGSDKTRIGLTLDQPGLVLEGADGTTISGLSIQGGDIRDTTGLVLSDVEFSGANCATGQCLGSTLLVDGSELAMWDVSFRDNHSSLTSGSPYLRAPISFENSWLVWIGGEVRENSLSGVTTAGNSNLHGLIGFGYTTATLDGVQVEANELLASSLRDDASTASVNAYGLFYGYVSTLDFKDVDLVDNSITCEGVNTGAGIGHAGCYGLWRLSSDIIWTWEGGLISGNTVEASSSTAAYGRLGSLGAGTSTFSDLRVEDNLLTLTGDVTSTCSGFDGNSVTRTWTRVQVLGNEVDCDGTFGGWTLNWFGADVFNNLILAGNQVGMGSTGVHTGLFYGNRGSVTVLNSVVHDNFVRANQAFGGVFYSESNSLSVVNTVLSSNQLGIDVYNSSFPGAAIGYTAGGDLAISYSTFWGNSSSSGEGFWAAGASRDIVGEANNNTLTPSYIDVSGEDPSTWDFSLEAGSELIDAGDPSIEDPDGSTSDIGAFGGPQSF